MRKDMANIILKMTWEELDDFAQRVSEIATDDNGEQNDNHYIASALIDTARDAVNA